MGDERRQFDLCQRQAKIEGSLIDKGLRSFWQKHPKRAARNHIVCVFVVARCPCGNALSPYGARVWPAFSEIINQIFTIPRRPYKYWVWGDFGGIITNGLACNRRGGVRPVSLQSCNTDTIVGTAGERGSPLRSYCYGIFRVFY